MVKFGVPFRPTPHPRGIDPERALAEIYREADSGFEIPEAEEALVRASRGDPLYGELLPESVTALLGWLELGEDDVFYDLGSGTGKVVLQVAMSAPVARCVGVELSESRLRIARSALRRAREHDLVLARRTVFRRGNFLDESLADATVVYTCSTGFSSELMRGIADAMADTGREIRYLTLQEAEPHPALEPLVMLPVAASWNRRTPVHVYRVIPLEER